MDDFNNFNSEETFDTESTDSNSSVAVALNVDHEECETWHETPASNALDVVVSNAVVTPQPSSARPMQKGRFFTGMLFAGGGIGLMLCVAVGALHSAGASGNLSLPSVALCMIAGLMLLGGGFGVMATAAPRFDDNEFDRLMRAGDLPLPSDSLTADSKSSDESGLG